MAVYEFSFATNELKGPDDERLASVAKGCRDTTAYSHGDLTVVVIAMEGANASRAGIQAAQLLIDSDLSPTRTVPDLVDRREISERADVRRQTVGNWARGDRMANTPFPTPYVMVSGELWLWGDVAAWLSNNGHFTESVKYPTAADHTRVDNWILEQQAAVTPSQRGRAEFADVSSILKNVAWPAGSIHGHRAPWLTGTAAFRMVASA
ncbi:hypothetical protein [Mycobacteroides abscessus]|uniref:hypothetical protein n=1 Tax=Mycobacteroides abscessus TaxID=36809 RepID=UPI00092C474B|nr:hypothetical protein [Mycobacteroides abscessus]MDO3327533.1 hypothetical protein [Mycobacteroides abscessus subsp. abscessus]SIK02836.1 Uncharacterised protein [Mycobacteroides abscessus subsp. abscessus]